MRLNRPARGRPRPSGAGVPAQAGHLRTQAPDWFVPCLVGLAACLTAATALGLMLDADPGGNGQYVPHPLAALTFLVVGGAIVPRQPRNALGWLLTAVGVVAGLSNAAASFAGGRVMFWVNQWLPALAYGLLPISLLLFPDGRLPGRGWRPALYFGLAAVSLASVTLAWAAWLSPEVLSGAEVDLEGLAGPVFSASRLGAVMVVVTTILAFASLIDRRRRADGDTRQQLRVLALGAVLVPIGIVLAILALPGADILLDSAVPIAVGAAILKYRLFDIDLFINRSLVYGSLTLLLALVYSGVAIALGLVLGDGWGSPLIATGVVAVAFQPLRARIQRAVGRLLYGDRDDPYTSVSRISQILEPATEPDALFPRLAEAVADALGLPFVGIEVVDASGSATLKASRGRVLPQIEAFPMIHNGRLVGRLQVAPRTIGGSFDSRERAILENLARQSGVAVDAIQLTDDLLASRARLVRSREDERRRLRRDLHDGLGPALAGAAMQVGAVRTAPPDQVEAILGRLEGILQTCLKEVRQIVEDLRPAPLAELGLIGGIRRTAAMFSESENAPRIQVSSELESVELPAAVEVAAYRIATEAITNVVKHSEAQNCRVSLDLNADLQIEIADDGRGIPDDYHAGVGLGSMRDRAEELGGRFTVERCPEGGTRILASIPLGVR